MLEWMISYRSHQKFFIDDANDRDRALADFADFDIEIDCEVDDPPMETVISEKKVDDLTIDGTSVERTISCSIHIKVTDEDGFKEMMEEEMHYDEDEDEYDIINAVNYWICDTCEEPDYGGFSGESCDYDVVQVKSSS